MTRGILVALALRLSIFAVGGLAAQVVPGDRLLEGGAVSFLFLLVLAGVQLAILRLALLRPLRLTPAALGWRAPRAGDVLLGVAGFAVAGGFVVGVFSLLGDLDPGRLAAAVLERTPRQELLFLGVGLLAAFTEESIYRGHLQPRLVGRWGPALGILATAALFAVLHLQPAPLPLLGKLGIGLVLGLLRERTGTLWAAGLAHTLIWVVFGMS